MKRNRIHLYFSFFIFLSFLSCKEPNKEDKKKTKSEINNQYKKNNNNEADSSIIEIENGIMTVKNKRIVMQGPVDKNEKRNGIWHRYDKKGNKLSMTEFKKNSQHGKSWVNYENGALHYKGNYINGKLNGTWFFYYQNGTIEIEKNYINGQKNGVWKYYYENGEPKREDYYKNNKILKSTCWDKTGNKILTN